MLAPAAAFATETKSNNSATQTRNPLIVCTGNRLCASGVRTRLVLLAVRLLLLGGLLEALQALVELVACVDGRLSIRAREHATSSEFGVSSPKRFVLLSFSRPFDALSTTQSGVDTSKTSKLIGRTAMGEVFGRLICLIAKPRRRSRNAQIDNDWGASIVVTQNPTSQAPRFFSRHYP